MIRRRAFLRLASLLPLAVTPRISWGSAEVPSVNSGAPDRQSGAARRIGETYLAAFPEEATSKALSQLPHDHEHLLQRVRDDFASGDTVILQGWVLSRTECQVCALAVLGRSAADVH